MKTSIAHLLKQSRSLIRIIQPRYYDHNYCPRANRVVAKFELSVWKYPINAVSKSIIDHGYESLFNESVLISIRNSSTCKWSEILSKSSSYLVCWQCRPNIKSVFIGVNSRAERNTLALEILVIDEVVDYLLVAHPI